MPDPSPKVALVTGASRGIGAAIARRLGADGYAVCVNYVANERAAQAVVDELTAGGVGAFAVQADVADERSVEALFETIDERLGRLSALVNNAAIVMRQCRVEDMTAERIERVFRTNVTGAFLCAREAVRRMSTRHGGNGGSIVNVSSAASRIGSANEYVDYAASKGAIDTLTRGLALEVAAEGIRVNCVRPGFVYTDMHASAGEPGRVDRLKPGIPLGRGGTPEEIANAVAWLVSAESAYCTGAFIDCAGGR